MSQTATPLPDPPAPPIRDAATIVLMRDMGDAGPAVLMGQRGKTAAFMPNKFVFPGGRVDAADADVPLAVAPDPASNAALERFSQPGCGPAIATAAIRELWEETGLRLSRPGPDGPDWAGFSAGGHQPDPSPLRFFFRAITPPGRPRRFDARFFTCPATALSGDADDFSAAGDELSHLQWIPLTHARQLDLPFITAVVLSELDARARGAATSPGIPFFDNSGLVSQFRML